MAKRPGPDVEKSGGDVEKSVAKSRRPLAGVAADPSLRGRGPAKGAPNAGRPPDEFKAMMAALASRPETLAAVQAILNDPSHGQFIRALEFATERGYGKAAQPLEHTGGIHHSVEVVRRIVDPAADEGGA